MNKISNSIGKQDHYSSFYKGIKYLRFNSDEKVIIKNINYLNFKKKIGSNLLFFFTGIQRYSNKILQNQNTKIKTNKHGLIELRNITNEIFEKVRKNRINFSEFGYYLNKSWLIKRSFSKKNVRFFGDLNSYAKS